VGKVNVVVGVEVDVDVEADVEVDVEDVDKLEIVFVDVLAGVDELELAGECIAVEVDVGVDAEDIDVLLDLVLRRTECAESCLRVWLESMLIQASMEESMSLMLTSQPLGLRSSELRCCCN